MIKAILLAGVISAGLAAPAFAGLPHVIKVECPLDGVKFDFVTTASHSTWGFHMDGKPVGLGHSRCPFRNARARGFRS